MPAYLRELHDHPHAIKTKELSAINTYFIHLMTNDIIAKKPEYIFVDASNPKASPVFAFYNFDYLALFLKDAAFRQLWKSYYPFAVIRVKNFYRLDIYKRKATIYHRVQR
jgi:hypothetical protein